MYKLFSLLLESNSDYNSVRSTILWLTNHADVSSHWNCNPLTYILQSHRISHLARCIVLLEKLRCGRKTRTSWRQRERVGDLSVKAIISASLSKISGRFARQRYSNSIINLSHGLLVSPLTITIVEYSKIRRLNKKINYDSIIFCVLNLHYTQYTY